MKIAYGSDLHLELEIPKPDMDGIQDADVLVLAGDIFKGRNAKSGQPLIMEYSKECMEALNIPVIVVSGNHELYGEELNRF